MSACYISSNDDAIFLRHWHINIHTHKHTHSYWFFATNATCILHIFYSPFKEEMLSDFVFFSRSVARQVHFLQNWKWLRISGVRAVLRFCCKFFHRKVILLNKTNRKQNVCACVCARIQRIKCIYYGSPLLSADQSVRGLYNRNGPFYCTRTNGFITGINDDIISRTRWNSRIKFKRINIKHHLRLFSTGHNKGGGTKCRWLSLII